jgi:glycosyltransferase involved in cell wall biosynthesis
MNYEAPFVSVVISTHNRRELLKATLESLFKQSYPKDRYEIIVVDDGSTDETGELIRSLQIGAPCALKYFLKEIEGPGVARNAGIFSARGSIIAFTDSDCLADPHWIENGVANMGDGVGLVQGKTLSIPGPNQKIRTFSRVTMIVKETDFYQTRNIFYRKEVIDLVGGFSPDFSGLNRFGYPMIGGEDADLAWRVKKRGWKSVFADEAVIYHHVHPFNLWKAILSIRKCHYLFYVIPYIVKKHPELRNNFYRRFFLSKNRALAILLLFSAVSGIMIHMGFLFLMIPYVLRVIKITFTGRPVKAFHRGLAVFFIYILRDLVDTILLTCGSIWYRSIVL